jgi:hypothetical protein
VIVLSVARLEMFRVGALYDVRLALQLQTLCTRPTDFVTVLLPFYEAMTVEDQHYIASMIDRIFSNRV